MANPSNTAAYIVSEKSHPFVVQPAPFVEPGENQVLVKNQALGINPIDGKLQKFPFFPLQYPTIFGSDVAGKIVRVGPGVVAFKEGDRVVGTPAGFSTKQDSEKGFQEYTILDISLSCKIPNGLSFVKAVVLPLAVTTASAGLFHSDYLNLQLPTHPRAAPTTQTVLIWGGASSVGSSAIQLAVAAGYEVVTTASPKNFEYVRALGASYVFDYNSPRVVDDLVEVLNDKTVLGAYDAIGGAAWLPVSEVIAKCSNARQFVATVLPGFKDLPEGVEMKQMFALAIRKTHVARSVWNEYLPEALEVGKFQAAPEPFIVGHGLDSVQKGVDVLMKGVSARKIVVTL